MIAFNRFHLGCDIRNRLSFARSKRQTTVNDIANLELNYRTHRMLISSGSTVTMEDTNNVIFHRKVALLDFDYLKIVLLANIERLGNSSNIGMNKLQADWANVLDFELDSLADTISFPLVGEVMFDAVVITEDILSQDFSVVHKSTLRNLHGESIFLTDNVVFLQQGGNVLHQHRKLCRYVPNAVKILNIAHQNTSVVIILFPILLEGEYTGAETQVLIAAHGFLALIAQDEIICTVPDLLTANAERIYFVENKHGRKRKREKLTGERFTYAAF